MNEHKQNWRLKIGAAASLALLLTACGEKAKIDLSQQLGNNPELPKAQNFLVPPMQVPDGVGWKGAR